MKPTLFFARSETVVVGYDSERADIDNPVGAVIEWDSYVVAEDAEGNRVQCYVKTAPIESVALAPANFMAAALQTRLTRLGKLPVGFDLWERCYPRYGSNAYLAEIETESESESW